MHRLHPYNWHQGFWRLMPKPEGLGQGREFQWRLSCFWKYYKFRIQETHLYWFVSHKTRVTNFLCIWTEIQFENHFFDGILPSRTNMVFPSLDLLSPDETIFILTGKLKIQPFYASKCHRNQYPCLGCRSRNRTQSLSVAGKNGLKFLI